MKVLVTGGAGFIGSHTAVELIKAGHVPIIVDNFTNSEPWIVDRIGEISGTTPALYRGDCCDKQFLKHVFEHEHNIEGVIHFAAHKAVGESVTDPLKYYRNNLLSLVTLLEVMEEHGVQRLVFSSSATVYGEAQENPIPETTPRNEAESPYGNTKLISEDIIRDTSRAGSLRAISLRYFNPIGAHPSGRLGELPRGVPACLVPYLTQTAAGIRERLTIFGDDYDTPDGTCIRDYLHVMDLARAHIASLEYLKNGTIKYDVFNVGTGRGTSVRELVTTFERVNGVTVPRTVGPRRPGDVVTCCAAVDKIEREMGWTATLTIEDALRDAWRWQQALAGQP